MTINFRYWKTRVVIYSLFAFGITAGLITTGLRFGLTKSDWASWVQAIGSIAAIGVAFAVANSQTRASRRQKVDDEVRRLETLRALFLHIAELAQTVRNSGEAGNMGSIGYAPWEHLAERRALVMQLSIFDAPDKDVAISMLSAPNALTDLGDALRESFRQSDDPGPFEYPAWPWVQRALNTIDQVSRRTIYLCDKAIDERKE